MSELIDRLHYVDEIVPEHDRTSCHDVNLYNSAYSVDDYEGRGRCYRCTLLRAATTGMGEIDGDDCDE